MTRWRWRRWRQFLTVVAIAGFACVYFGYHALYGQLGLLAWEDVKTELHITSAALADAEAANADLRRRIAGLRPESPDPDAIETALRDLGYRRPGEWLLIDP